jgi:hypothetical protein
MRSLKFNLISWVLLETMSTASDKRKRTRHILSLLTFFSKRKKRNKRMCMLCIKERSIYTERDRWNGKTRNSLALSALEGDSASTRPGTRTRRWPLAPRADVGSLVQHHVMYRGVIVIVHLLFVASVSNFMLQMKEAQINFFAHKICQFSCCQNIRIIFIA